MFNDAGNIEVYHLLNMLFGVVGFYAVYELVLQATKKPVFGLLGSAMLFLTPRFSGDMAVNVKDAVFAVLYIFTYGRENEWDRAGGTVVYTVERFGVPLMKIFAVAQE